MNPTFCKLSNGLRVVYVPMPAVRSVTVAAFVGVGSRHERATTSGVSHLLEHLLFRGTARRPRARMVSEVLDSVGGILNASTDKELTVYWAKVATEHLVEAVDLLADLLQNSLLRQTDIRKEKGIIEEELGMIADDPQDRVQVLADEVLWPDQAIGREIAGTRESVRALRRPQVLQHASAYYGPNNVVICVAGGVSADAVFASVGRCFETWAPVSAPPSAAARFGPDGVRRIEGKDTEQVNLSLAFPGVHRRHADRWAIDMLCTVLGGAASSRLFVELRDRLAMVYDVHMGAGYFGDTGSVIVSAGVDPARAEQALDAIQRQIDRVARRRVSDVELWKARSLFRGRMWLGLEDSQAMASWYGAQHILTDDVLSPEQLLSRINAVSAPDLTRVARKYLNPESARIVAVGPILSAG